MKLSDLQIFVDVIEAGGMTQSAQRKGVSQSGISRTVRDIESKMQAHLLRRTGRGVELTAAGTEFHQFALQTLAAFGETQNRIHALSVSLPKKLSVAVPLRLGRLLVPELYRRFANSMPEVDFQAYEERSDRVAEGNFDLAVSYAPTGIDTDVATAVIQESLYLLGTTPIIEDSDAPITLSTLSDLPLMLPSNPRYRRLIDNAFRKAGLQMRVTRELESTEASLAFASEGEGVAILPYSNIYPEVARGEVIARLIVEPCIERKIYLQVGRHLDRRITRPAVKTLQESLLSVAEVAKWQWLGARP